MNPEDLSMISDITASPTKSSPSKPSSSSQPTPAKSNEAIFARYVARLEEAGDEDLETLGVEGVEPTLEVMEWADGLRTRVSTTVTRNVSGGLILSPAGGGKERAGGTDTRDI